MIAGTLEVQLLANMARLQKDMDDAKRTVGDAMKSIESAVNVAKMAFVAFAGVASINAFKNMVQGSIEATAGLHDMAIQTGASVSALMAFRSVAATTNTSIEGIAGAMNKMAKGMAVANEDSKGIGQAVQALGLNFNELRRMKPEDQMLAVAKAMDGFQDGAGKSAAAMALYGKEGAKMLPFLKDLADGSEEVTQKLTEQQVKAKAAQAAMADDYTDNLVKIKKASEAWKKDISMAMLPVLYEFSQAFLDVNKGAGGVKAGISNLANDGSITDWVRAAITGVTYVFDAFAGVVRVVNTVGQTIGAVAAIVAESFGAMGTVIGKVLRGDFSGALAENEAAGKRQKAIWGDLKDTLDKSWSEQTFGQQLRARAEELRGVAVTAKEVKKELDFKAPEDQAKGRAEKISDYQKLTRLIAEKQAQDQAQLAIGQELAESEKIRAKMMADLATGSIKLSKIEKERLNQGLDQLALTERQIAATKALEVYTKKQADETATISARAQAVEDEVAAYGLTKDALRQLTVARLEDQAAQIQRFEPSEVAQAEVAAIEARIAAIKRLGAAETALEAKDAATKAAHKAEEEWKRAAEKINESITDALMRGFESGKGFAENLRDTVVNMFKTLVLRPTVSAIVNPVAQGLTGALGLAGTANAAGAAGNALPFLGAGGLGGALMGGAGWMTGATTLGGALSAGASLLGTGTVAGGLSGLGMIAGALGPIGLGIAALSMIGNKDTPTASTGNASARYDALGNRTDYQTYYGGSSAGVDAMLANLQASYAATAKSLGIIAQATSFSYGGNTGKDGAAPNFALGGGAGNVSFYQGETASSDAAISLAASRAVFAALQGSDLPAYLSKVFDGITASTATQEQITNTLAYAQSLKQVRDALLETREPLQILKDNVAQGFATLATSADTFKADFVAAIDAGITPDKLAQWQGLQTAMTQLAQASGKATEAVKEVGRSIADIASERTRLQDQLDELTMTSAQLLDKQRNAIDDSNKSLFDQVQAQIQLKDAAQAVADAQVAAANAQVAAANAQIAAAEALRAAASQRLSTASAGAADALSALNRAVAAQKAQETAALAAQKAAAEAIYKAQASALQTSMDTAKASLDAVTNSVGKLKSLSGSLRSTLDGMRIAGSDGAYRANAQAQISAALAKARSGGGLPLDGQLASALAIVSKPSEQLFATFEDYARDFYKTANDISALADLTDSQLSADEVTQAILQEQSDKLSAQQRTLKDGFADQVSSLDAILSTAQQQLDAANGLDVSVLSIADALNQFNASVLKLANERAAQGLPTTAGVADGRAVAIRDYITSAASTLSGSELANTIAAKAKEVGVSEAEIASSIGWAKSKVREFFAGAGIPQFDVGTDYVPRDMLAMIHEGERITPKAYNPAAGGSGNADLIAEIRALREEVRQLQQSSSTTATATKKTAAMIETATEGGRAMLTETYT